jgi:uncharacterized integral membrane protein
MITKIFYSILLGVAAVILIIFVIIALNEGVVHGRFDGKVYVETAPLQYWGAILLQFTIIGMLIYMIVKIWKNKN